VASYQGVIGAARRRLQIMRELDALEGAREGGGLNPASERRIDSLEREKELLEDRYPAVEDLNSEHAIDVHREAMGGGAGTTRGAAEELGEFVEESDVEAPDHDQGARGESSRGRRDGGRGDRGAGRPARRRGGRPRLDPRVRRRARGAFEQTRIPAATRSITQSALQLVGLVIGLSLAYLLLTDAQRKGRPAIAAIASGFTEGLTRFVAPTDPLRPRSVHATFAPGVHPTKQQRKLADRFAQGRIPPLVPLASLPSSRGKTGKGAGK
jgi:hypothetical protein